MKFSNLTYNKVVALGIPALLVALLIAAAVSMNNVNDAQAQEPGGGPGLGPIGGDLNKINYDPPFPCDGEEPVPHGAAASVDDGHYAAFDAFWDYNKGELSNNFCPPGVVHTEEEDEDTGVTEIVTTRTESNIDIRKTVFSIPDSHKAEIVESTSPGNGQISRGIYEFLPDTSSEVWWLKADDDTTLVMGFSAGLLKAEHWENPVEGEKAVQYEFEARERPTCADPDEEAHFYVFRDSDVPVQTATWNSSKVDETDLGLDPGEYEHFNWVFTCPGTYRVQIQFKGYVKHPSPLGIGRDVAETSVAWLYTFHVGPEDDLGVSITANDPAPALSATSTSFTVKATNGGPDTAHDAVVQIRLPEGLEADTSTLPSSATYELGIIAWDLGQMAPAVSSSTRTLDFTASISQFVGGRVTAVAEIRNVGNEDLDPNSDNNISTAHVQLARALAQPPSFGGFALSVPEHAGSGAHVGDPIVANNPSGGQLIYSLSGRFEDWFEVQASGQVTLQDNVTLDYRKQWTIPLTVWVTDQLGGSAGDSAPVTIEVIDTPSGSVYPTVSFALSNPAPGTQRYLNLEHPVVGYTVIITPTVNNLPSGVSLEFGWEDSQGRIPYYEGGDGDKPVLTFNAGDHTYRVHIKWNGGGVTAEHTIHWYEPSEEYPGPNGP